MGFVQICQISVFPLRFRPRLSSRSRPPSSSRLASTRRLRFQFPCLRVARSSAIAQNSALTMCTVLPRYLRRRLSMFWERDCRDLVAWPLEPTNTRRRQLRLRSDTQSISNLCGPPSTPPDARTRQILHSRALCYSRLHQLQKKTRPRMGPRAGSNRAIRSTAPRVLFRSCGRPSRARRRARRWPRK